MRWIAKVSGDHKVKRLMIHESNDGAYLFIFEIEEDGGCSSDYWFENVEDAFAEAEDSFGIKRSEWKEIAEPLEHCQQDWIAPARIPGRESGNPEFGKLDVLKDGKWIRIMG